MGPRCSDALCGGIFSSIRPVIAGLEIQNSFRYHAAGDKISQSEDIAQQSSAPVNIRLWSCRPHDVHRHVAGDVADGAPQRVSLALSEQIERVCNLRVAQFEAGTAPKLGAKVNPVSLAKLHNVTTRRHLAGQVNIFLPAVQWQTLVEAEVMLPQRRQPDRHVAPIT